MKKQITSVSWVTRYAQCWQRCLGPHTAPCMILLGRGIL